MRASDRARLLWRLAEQVDAHREVLARIESRDNGKALRESRAELDAIVRYFEFFAGVCQNVLGPHDARRRAVLHVHAARAGRRRRRDRPVELAAPDARVEALPALAGGNTIVLKPAEDTPVSACAFAALAEQVDIPPGVINIVPGYGARAGQALVEHRDVDKIAFTGSTETGKRIAQAAAGTLKLVTFELGGKSPNIIFEDADLETAVSRSAFGIFSASGQSCMAASRTLVHSSVREEFVELFAAKADAIRVGDPLDPATQVGATTSERQLEKVRDYVGIAVAEGAHVAAGGTSPDGGKGWFFRPTILDGVDNGMRVAREEISAR